MESRKTPLREMRDAVHRADREPLTLAAVCREVKKLKHHVSIGHLSALERGVSPASIRLLSVLAQVYDEPRERVITAYRAGCRSWSHRLSRKPPRHAARDRRRKGVAA